MTVAAAADAPHVPPPRAPYDARDLTVIGGAAVSAAVVALLVQNSALSRLQPLVGLIVIMTIAVRVLDQPARHRSPDGRVGPRAADRVRAAGAQDHRRAARVPDARRRHQSPARFRVRRIELRLRPSRGQGGVAADHDGRPRARGRALRRGLRVHGAADDHLHRGALRHPLLLRHHAARGAGCLRSSCTGSCARPAPSRSTWRRASSWGRPRRRSPSVRTCRA